MNIKSGTITSIAQDDFFNMITVDVDNGSLRIVDVKSPYAIAEGDKVNVKFQEISVSLSVCDKVGKVISVENSIPATYSGCRKGEIFSEVRMHTACGELVSLVSTPVFEEMKLETGARVTALLKGSDIKLEPVFDSI